MFAFFSSIRARSIRDEHNTAANRRDLGILKHRLCPCHVSRFKSLICHNAFLIIRELRFENLRIIKGLHTKKEDIYTDNIRKFPKKWTL